MRGVSTRRVEGLVRQLGIERISKSRVSEMAKELDASVEAFRSRPLHQAPYTYVWLDALTQKVREDGRIRNVAGVIATGVNAAVGWAAAPSSRLATLRERVQVLGPLLSIARRLCSGRPERISARSLLGSS